MEVKRLSMKDPRDNVRILAEKIDEADAILIGAGSGLSSAAGYDHYHWSGEMASELKEFKEYYGFTSPLAGFYHCYPSAETQWGYYSKYISFIRKAETGKPYYDLKQLTENKAFFVLTSNVDSLFSRIYPEENICLFQGDFRYFQCSQPCHDRIHDNSALTDEMLKAMQGVSVPTELLPRCPECGRLMVPWVRDDSFLEGNAWKRGIENYRRFLREFLMERPGNKLLLLELGVGEMSPGIIKLPFWEIAAKNENVFYTCMNRIPGSAPAQLEDRSLYINGDLGGSLSELRHQLNK